LNALTRTTPDICHGGEYHLNVIFQLSPELRISGHSNPQNEGFLFETQEFHHHVCI